MISGVDVKATQEYTCEEDKNNPTVWILGVLPSRLFKGLISRATADNSIELLYSAVSIALKGFKNFSVKGKPVEFETFVTDRYAVPIKIVTDDIMDSIPMKVVTELAGEIMKNSKLSEDEEKN